MPFGLFLPREYNFFDLFEQHAAACDQAAKALLEMAVEPARAEEITFRIKELEHEGDKVTHRTVEALHKTFITPIDRDEIHKLIGALDDVLDFIYAVAQRIILFEIGEFTDEATALCRVLAAATERVAQAISRLRDMKNSQELFEDCQEINRLENEADEALRRGLARLFKEYADKPVEIIKWKEIYEYLEQAADCTEDVANIIEGIVLEHA